MRILINILIFSTMTFLSCEKENEIIFTDLNHFENKILERFDLNDRELIVASDVFLNAKSGVKINSDGTMDLFSFDSNVNTWELVESKNKYVWEFSKSLEGIGYDLYITVHPIEGEPKVLNLHFHKIEATTFFVSEVSAESNTYFITISQYQNTL
ncbi:MAG: hypothetical protein OEW67_13345 [Cyclobacteriaceae bacterium]|nr:hypothetical protein [Cyclobacteriaceae bacterium]